MKGDRLRVPVEDAYVTALGRAAYVFSSVEWNAVYCCEKLETGFVQKAVKLTAGQIADKLLSLMKKRPARAVDWQRCVDAAAEFKRLTRRRNDLMHANPGTAPNGEQQLFRHGAQWTAQAVDDVADEFAANGIILNELYYRVL
jgi:hypothetical protein